MPDELLAAIRGRVFPDPTEGAASAAARFLVEVGGDAVAAVIFFGSRKTQAGPDASSSYDFFVVVRSYLPFYEQLQRGGLLRRNPRLCAALNHVLPPNQIAIQAGPGDDCVRTKCAVISLAAFLEATSTKRRDHFVAGRFFQPVEVMYASEDVRSPILDAVVRAHRLTYGWVRPWLAAEFDLEAYCRALLRVSYAGEVRPEPGGRAEALWRAQESYMRPVYGALLAELVDAGELSPTVEGRYHLRNRVGRWERWGTAAYFQLSKLRATARWAKYVVTFDDWLEFILRKARRHGGEDIALSERERRMPLVFLWPRVVRYLRHKDR